MLTYTVGGGGWGAVLGPWQLLMDQSEESSLQALPGPICSQPKLPSSLAFPLGTLSSFQELGNEAMFPLFVPFGSLKLPVLFSGPPLFSIPKAPMCLQAAGRPGGCGGTLH